MVRLRQDRVGSVSDLGLDAQNARGHRRSDPTRHQLASLFCGAILAQKLSGLSLERAPGHHGYQRACELITGKASSGQFGSPVFACAGKTEPPSRLILSQTSAITGLLANVHAA